MCQVKTAACLHTLHLFREKINPWVDLAQEGEVFYQHTSNQCQPVSWFQFKCVIVLMIFITFVPHSPMPWSLSFGIPRGGMGCQLEDQ